MSEPPVSDIERSQAGDCECTPACKADTRAKKKRRRLVLTLCPVAVVAIALVSVTAILLTAPPETAAIEEARVPLSSVSSGSGGSAGSSASGKREDAADNAAVSSGTSSGIASPGESESNAPEGRASTTDQGAAGNGGTPTSENTREPIWNPPWDEQVWVDTSSYQSVYVGENPIYEQHDVCNTCGILLLNGIGPRHLLDTGHSGYHSQMIQVGTEPYYENQWVESGHWTTIHHEGYWS